MSELEGDMIKRGPGRPPKTGLTDVEQLTPRTAISAPSGSRVVGEPDDPVTAPETPPGYVRCRVLKKGDRRIFTGVTVLLATEKFPTFRHRDELNLPRDLAEQYEEVQGWVEIL